MRSCMVSEAKCRVSPSSLRSALATAARDREPQQPYPEGAGGDCGTDAYEGGRADSPFSCATIESTIVRSAHFIRSTASTMVRFAWASKNALTSQKASTSLSVISPRLSMSHFSAASSSLVSSLTQHRVLPHIKFTSLPQHPRLSPRANVCATRYRPRAVSNRASAASTETVSSASMACLIATHQ